MDFTLPEPTRHFSRGQELPAAWSFRDAIHTMAHEVAGLLGLPAAADEISRTALQREEEECTFVGRGLAVPHARLKGLPHAAVYTARCPEGLPWPQDPAEVVALLVVPEEQPELHLSLLSTLIRARLKGHL